MVKLNPRLLLSGISGVNIDKRDLVEVAKQFHRVTHLHLQNKRITKLMNLDKFINLTVLYLYENQITKIAGLHGSINLEALHLQKNELDRVNGLTECTKLQKLFLGYNAIQCLDGLDKLVELQELHVEYQRLKPTDHLMIDPMSLNTLASCLQLLDISGNHIFTLEDLAGLRIHTLIARDNRIEDLDNTTIIISTLSNLHVLDLKNNGITKIPKYREKIIGYSLRLELLDGKEVSECSRRFMQGFCRMKAARLKRVIGSFQDLPIHVPKTNTSAEKTIAQQFSEQGFDRRQEVGFPLGYSEYVQDKYINQEPNGLGPMRSSMTQVRTQSLQLLHPDMRQPPKQPWSTHQFVPAPTTFLNEPKQKIQPKVLKNKNKFNNVRSEFSHPQKVETLFRRENAPLSRVVAILEENEDDEVTELDVRSNGVDSESVIPLHPMSNSIAMSNQPIDVRADAEFVPEEFTSPEAHYTELIGSDDLPVSEFAKLMLELHSSPRNEGAAGDTITTTQQQNQQENGINWMAMSQEVFLGSLDPVQMSGSTFTPGESVAHSQINLNPEAARWQQWSNYNLTEEELMGPSTFPSSDKDKNSTFASDHLHRPRYIPKISNNPYQPQLSQSVSFTKYSPNSLSKSKIIHTKPKTGKEKINQSPSQDIFNKKEMKPIPIFQEQVFQLPPWPHIIKMGSKEPRITYMP